MQASSPLAPEVDREALKKRLNVIREGMMGVYDDLSEIPRAVIVHKPLLEEIGTATPEQLVRLTNVIEAFERQLEQAQVERRKVQVKSPKKASKAKARSVSFMPTPPAPKHEVDCTRLPGRIADLTDVVIYDVYDNKKNGLKWRFASKEKLRNATKNPAGIKHVAAFVTACEEAQREWLKS